MSGYPMSVTITCGPNFSPEQAQKVLEALVPSGGQVVWHESYRSGPDISQMGEEPGSTRLNTEHRFTLYAASPVCGICQGDLIGTELVYTTCGQCGGRALQPQPYVIEDRGGITIEEPADVR